MTPRKINKKKSVKTKKVSPAKAMLKKKAKKKSKAQPKKSTKKKSKRRKVVAPVRRQTITSAAYETPGKRARSGGQSGDLQGLSDLAVADSESVDELLEEGNAFEAEVVAGIENAADADQGEVRTHEVLENDVPEEYLDKDEQA